MSRDLKEDLSALQQPPSLRDQASMAAAHQEFLTKGKGDISVVKEYYNVYSPPFFDIPLSQVSKYFEWALKKLMFKLGLHSWAAYQSGDLL